MIYTTDFDDLSHSLIKLDAVTEAAEAQGLFCGILCALGRVEKQSWARQVIGEAAASGGSLVRELTDQLESLYDESMQSLYDDELGFQLFIPDDEVSIGERMQSLSEWCQGFLLGFSMRNLDTIEGEVRGEIDELLQDFVGVTQIDVEVVDNDEDDEESIVEIQEYIRMGVIYIFTTLHPVAASTRLQ